MLTSGGTAATMAQGAGMMAGVLGPIALGIAALTSIIGKTKGETRVGGQFGVAYDGGVYNQRRGQAYTYEGQQFDRDFSNGARVGLTDGQAYRLEGDKVANEQALRDAVAGTASTINDLLKGIGSSLSLTGFSAGLETSTKDRGGNFAGGILGDGVAFGESGKGDNYAGTLYELFSTRSPDFKTAVENFTLDLKQATLQSIQAAAQYAAEKGEEFPALIAKKFKGVDFEALTSEQTDEYLNFVNTQIEGVKRLRQAFDAMGMDHLAEVSFDVASGLAEVSGGFDNFLTNLSNFYTNFVSADEQRANMQRVLQNALSAVNLQLPDIDATDARAQYAALVKAAENDMSEQGRKAYAALIANAGAFASITKTVESATDALDKQRDSHLKALERSVAAEKKALQTRLDAAQDIVSTLGGLVDILHSNVRELYGQTDATRAMLAQQGNDFILKALQTAQKTGYLPDADELADAISGARGWLDVANFGGDAAERDYAANVLAGRLQGLERIAGKQLTDAQKTVRELEFQTGQLDQELEYWRDHLAIANNTYEAITSVAEAVENLRGDFQNGSTKPGGANTVGGGTTPSAGGGAVPRANYGADEALTSFEKFKAWYAGIRVNADPRVLMNEGYQVPDWMRVHNGADDATDKEQFGSYLFFKNNPQYAKDLEQVYSTGRSSYATDGSTLVRSDLSKMPTDVADYYRNNRDELLASEGFGLDPVLAYQLYNFGPQQFGLDGKRQSFTEWLQTTKWTPEGLVANNNVVSYAQMGYSNYNLARWDTSSGNIVDVDGRMYTPDGKYIGNASRAQLDAIYGAGYQPTTSGSRSSLYNSQVNGGASEADYYGAIKTNLDKAIADGWSAQQLVDAVTSTGASLQDVAAAYGISLAQVQENLRAGGATNIPQFRGGGSHWGGLRIVGEDGPELEATGPSRIWNQQQLADALGGGGNGRLEEFFLKLTTEIQLLKSAFEVGANHSGDTLALLRDVKNGNALIVQTAPA
ncbi:hypothetical protein OIN59_11980 [Acidovorax sp. D2M1]|uniref:LysM domain-containing protein n=1 Tax=Acidovorax benzenivorans TaxID=2987520 RepID=A0ABT5RWS8_9BURK|nr:hypothetical protein [Acidovorax benzenivorans]MDD2178154.1 hypothetical protein [Acidovorax benzenivorans]